MTRVFRRRFWAVLASASAVAFLLPWVPGASPGLDFLRYARAGTLVVRGEGAKIYQVPAGPGSLVWAGTAMEGKERSFRYPPGAAVLAAPLGIASPGRTWPAWSAACAALLVATAGISVLFALRRLPPGGPAWLPAAAILPLLPLLLRNLAEGQAACVVLGLCALSLLALDRGRDRAAGLLAGAAVAIKLVPILLVLWFSWKRRWKAAAWGLGGTALLFYGLPVAVLGPGTAHGLLGHWAAQRDPLVTEVDERPGTQASPGAVNLEGQSVGAILGRWCTPTPFSRVRDRPLVPGPGDDPWISIHGGRALDPATVRGIWLAAAFSLLAVAILATAPPGEEEGEDAGEAARRFPLEGGLVLAAVALLSPESREIHFIALAPLLAALAAGLAERRGAASAATAVVAGIGALLVLLPADLLVGRAFANELLARGAVGLGGLLLFGAGAATLFRERHAAARAGGSPAP